MLGGLVGLVEIFIGVMASLRVDFVVYFFVLLSDRVEFIDSVIEFRIEVVLPPVVNQFFVYLAELFSLLNHNH